MTPTDGARRMSATTSAALLRTHAYRVGVSSITGIWRYGAVRSR